LLGLDDFQLYGTGADPELPGIGATLDEASYTPGALHMGDHPIAWTRCVGDGRSFYSAIGHMPATYSEPHYVRLLEQGIGWAAGDGKTRCRAGKQVGARSGS